MRLERIARVERRHGHVLLAPLNKTVAAGANTTLHCAAAAEMGGVSGRWLEHCTEAPTPPEARDPRAARRIWDITAKTVGLGSGL